MVPYLVERLSSAIVSDDTIVWSPIGRFVHRIEPDVIGLFGEKWDQAMMAEFASPGLQQGLGRELQTLGWLKSGGLGCSGAV
jgi:hypothetical protein